MCIPSTRKRIRVHGLSFDNIRHHFDLKESPLNIQVMKIQSPEYTDGFCQFTGGGGDIVITTGKMTQLIYQPTDKESQSISPNRDHESIVSLSIEGKTKLRH